MYLSNLGDSPVLSNTGPIAFPPDLAAVINSEFAKYQAAIASIPVPTNNQYSPLFSSMKATQLRNLIPSWYTFFNPPFLDVSQGANGNTGYVSFRQLNRNGMPLWEVKADYKLNEGDQNISPSMAANAGGILMPPPPAFPSPYSYLFVYDPRPFLPVGQVGAGYKPGPSGKSITMGVVKGLAMTILPVVGGVVAAPLIFGAAGAGAAGAAGAAAGAAITPAATAVGTAAGGAALDVALPAAILPGALPIAQAVTTAGGGTAFTAPAAATSAAGTSAGAAASGVALPSVGGVTGAVGAVKSLLAMAQKFQAQGNTAAANQATAQAQQVATENGISIPGVGTVPLSWLVIGAIAAKLLFF